MDEDVDPFTIPLWLRRELLKEGWYDHAISRQVRSGEWMRPRRGAYAEARTWSRLDAAARHVVRTRAVIRQAETDVVASHTTAVPFYEGSTWGLALDDVHTTRTDGKTGRKEAGVHQHCGLLIDGDVEVVRGHDVMSPTRVPIEVSTTSSLESALVVFNDFLHRGLTTAEQVRTRYDATMDHWPRSRATEIMIRLGDPRIASVLESRFWFFCFRAGLPRPVPQFEVFSPDGHLVACLDFAWPDLGAYVETNGKAKYLQLLEPGQTPGDAIERERRREELVGDLTGFRGMHVGWDDLEHPVLTEQRLRRHLSPRPRSA